MIVTRGDLTLDVVPAPDVDLWDFWGRFAAGLWEAETLAVLDRFLTADGGYVDVGAWIGPTVLYAAPRCRKIVAVEPDPVAFGQLRRNLELNPAGDVSLVAGAVAAHRDGTLLHRRGRWGDSMSSTVTGGGESMRVATWLLSDVVGWLPGRVDLVKMDIEGAEAEVLPHSIGFLEERRIPCLVSLHEDFWRQGGGAAVTTALERFSRLSVLADGAPWGYRTVLGEWE